MHVDPLSAFRRNFSPYSWGYMSSGLQLAALFSAGSVLSPSRGFATIIRLALVVAT
jgi:hypothetical protein